MTDLHHVNATYTRQWYEDVRAGLGEEYGTLARIIDETFMVDTVIDVGCGSGLVIEELQRRGRCVAGIDGSAHAVGTASPSVAPHIEVADLRRPLVDQIPTDLGRFDLVVCTEVAEHLPESASYQLVQTLVSLAKGPIYFTAAPPGQGGTDHVNEQPAQYWLDRFAHNGYALDAPRSTEMCRRLEVLKGMHWFQRSSMVLVPR